MCDENQMWFNEQDDEPAPLLICTCGAKLTLIGIERRANGRVTYEEYKGTAMSDGERENEISTGGISRFIDQAEYNPLNSIQIDGEIKFEGTMIANGQKYLITGTLVNPTLSMDVLFASELNGTARRRVRIEGVALENGPTILTTPVSDSTPTPISSAIPSPETKIREYKRAIELPTRDK